MSNQTFAKFSVPGVTFSKREGVELITVENIHAKAVVSTYGACVLSFVAQGQKDLLWVSDQAVYDGSKPIRGGIPICWPWFGKAKEAGLPAHGFVRNMLWQVAEVTQLKQGATKLRLTCQSNAETLKLWPHQFVLNLSVEIGEALTLTLTTSNLSEQPVNITEALHTYFAAANPAGMAINGLENSTHIDTLLKDAHPVVQQNQVILNPPKDSVYLNQTGPVRLLDVDNHRKITIEKQSSQSSVVWNPGPEIVKGFADIDDQAWLDFVCVESGNVFDNFVTISPKQEHSLRVKYRIVSI